MLGATDKIMFDSTYGVGSRFWFNIKMKVRQPKEVSETDHSDQLRIRDEDLTSDVGREFGSKLNSLMHRNSMKNMLKLRVPHHNRLNSLSFRNKKPSQTNVIDLPILSDEEQFLRHQCADILIVDDNEFNICSLQKILTKIFGLNCESAYNGLQCIEKVEKKRIEIKSCEFCREPYKIILMDCDMPVMDGLEASRRLRVKMKEGHLPKIPIIACTALAFKQELEKCLEAGMDDYITKPINTSSLREKIERWLLVQ
jgi:CheY-like chemotaxis protein